MPRPSEHMSEQNAESGNARPKQDALTTRQAAYVAHRLTGLSQKTAADKIGIATRTARTWEGLPQVRAALKAGQDELIGEATATATALLRPALVKLMALGDDTEAPATARVSALRAVADLALKLGEVDDVAQRLSDVERRLDEHSPQAGAGGITLVA